MLKGKVYVYTKRGSKVLVHSRLVSRVRAYLDEFGYNKLINELEVAVDNIEKFEVQKAANTDYQATEEQIQSFNFLKALIDEIAQSEIVSNNIEKSVNTDTQTTTDFISALQNIKALSDT